MRSPLELGLALALALAACDETEGEETVVDEEAAIARAEALEERPCPEDSFLTWDNFGGPFVLTYCTGCHSSALAEADRQGAPPGSDFDTLEDVRRWAPRIWARSGDHNATMPPVGVPEDPDRRDLGEWLACGAPAADDDPR